MAVDLSETAQVQLLTTSDDLYAVAEERIRRERNNDPSNLLKLDRHTTVSSAYIWEGEVRSKLFARLFGAKAKGKRVGVFQEAKSFTVLLDEDRKEYEVGVAVRMEINADKFDLDAQITIPNIAAEAQLGNSKAEMEINVLGYFGPLGEILPAPRAVDVTSFAEYLESFRKIQELVFSAEGMQFHHPIPLGERRVVKPAANN